MIHWLLLDASLAVKSGRASKMRIMMKFGTSKKRRRPNRIMQSIVYPMGPLVTLTSAVTACEKVFKDTISEDVYLS